MKSRKRPETLKTPKTSDEKQEEAMMKKPSIRRNRIALVLISIGTLIFVMGMSSLIAMGVGAVLLIAGFVLALRENRCPYCGESFRGIHWNADHPFHFNRCGKRIEFDK